MTVIATIDGQRTQPISAAQAVEAARHLVAYYPDKAYHDPEIFVVGASVNFEGRDLNIVRRVLDPKLGIPAKNKFPPSIAEIKAALEEAERHRFTVRATAKWMIEEHERRKRAAEEEARWNLSPEEMERRRLQVAELMKGPKL